MQSCSLRFLLFSDGALFYVRRTPFHAFGNSKESKLSSHAEVSTRVFSSSFPLPAVNGTQHCWLLKKPATGTLLHRILKNWGTAGITSFQTQSSRILQTFSRFTFCGQLFFPVKILCHNKTVLIVYKVCNHALEHTCSGYSAHLLLCRC